MPKPIIEPPYFPIIYVRGYAMTQSEVEETVATPYMGFNMGSTKIRQRWDGSVERHIFESPLVRLMKDFGYRDAYQNGDEIPAGQMVPARSIFVYRYYDQASKAFGAGERPEIETYAAGLSDLILRVRHHVCGEDGAAHAAFRVYLVAHSMGGLVCRCFLQNPEAAPAEAKKQAARQGKSATETKRLVAAARKNAAEGRKLVHKAFTYATPHNGIEAQAIGNVPGFLAFNNIENFNRKRMAKYLALPGKPERVDTLNGKFKPERFFCLVGTNAKDYAAAAGWAARAVGDFSDGLVRVENASVQGAPRAFIHRSHSGHYGIVNSESGYQSLTRFLFGDVRVDGVLRVKELTLPTQLESERKAGKRIRASYHFEVVVRVRGERWDLHRRTVDTNSAIFRKYDEMFPRSGRGKGKKTRHPHLFSLFLHNQARVVQDRESLGFSVDLGVLVPEYEIDNKFWKDDYYEGGYIFRDKINLEVTPPQRKAGRWNLQYGFDSQTANQTKMENTVLPETGPDGSLVFSIPIKGGEGDPRIGAVLELVARPWNRWLSE